MRYITFIIFFLSIYCAHAVQVQVQDRTESTDSVQVTRDGRLLYADAEEDLKQNNASIFFKIIEEKKSEKAKDYPIPAPHLEKLKKNFELGKKAAKMYPFSSHIKLLKAVRLKQDGKIQEKEVHEVVYVNRSEALNFRKLHIPFFKGRSIAKVNFCYIASADGKFINHPGASFKEDFLSPDSPFNPLMRNLSSLLPQVTVGSLVEYSYTIVTYAPDKDDLFSYKFTFHENAPILEASFDAIVPTASKLNIETDFISAEKVNPETKLSLADNLKTYHWIMKDLEPKTEKAGQIFISTVPSWAFQREINQKNTLTSNETSQIINKLIKSASQGTSENEKVKLLTRSFFENYRITAASLRQYQQDAMPYYADFKGGFLTPYESAKLLSDSLKFLKFKPLVLWYPEEKSSVKLRPGSKLNHFYIEVKTEKLETLGYILPLQKAFSTSLPTELKKEALDYDNGKISLQAPKKKAAQNVINIAFTSSINSENKAKISQKITYLSELGKQQKALWQKIPSANNFMEFNRFLPASHKTLLQDFSHGSEGKDVKSYALLFNYESEMPYIPANKYKSPLPWLSRQIIKDREGKLLPFDQINISLQINFPGELTPSSSFENSYKVFNDSKDIKFTSQKSQGKEVYQIVLKKYAGQTEDSFKETINKLDMLLRAGFILKRTGK